MSLDGNFWHGGKTSVNGVENAATLQKNSRVGITASLPLTRHQSLKVSCARGAYSRFGGDYRIFSAVWQRWPMTSPQPGGGLTSAEARLQTLYGEAVSGSSLAGGRLTVSVTVPPNARGTVRLPEAAVAAVTESGPAVASAPGVARAAQDGEDVVVEVGSGQYVLAYDAGAGLFGRTKRGPGSGSRRSWAP